MYPLLAERLYTVLDLERHMVGVKFYSNQEGFDRADARLIDRTARYCVTIGQASRGETVKLRAIHNTCPGSSEALGFKEIPDEGVLDGKRFSDFRLYENPTIAKKAQESISILPQRPYGYVTGPIEDMEDADVVIVFCNPYQAMRINQGYAYKFGMARQWGSIGNEALCSDLTARPIANQDMNISFFCCGARSASRAGDHEMAIALPIAQFPLVGDGILKTVNEAMNNQRKMAILERCRERGCDLGFEIVFNHMYGSYDPD